METEKTIELETTGDLMEKRILNGETVMTKVEAERLRNKFGEWLVSLDEVKAKGDLNKQANRVLEGFRWEREGVMVDMVANCVLGISKLESGAVTKKGLPSDDEQLRTYVNYYFRLNEDKEGYHFPLNADMLGKITVPDVVRQEFENTPLDLQKVGYRVEAVVSAINRLMYYCAPNEEEYTKRIEDPEVMTSLHGLQNRVLRGYEKAGKGEEIKVDLEAYGEEDKRKLIRHLPIGSMSVILEEIEKGYK